MIETDEQAMIDGFTMAFDENTATLQRSQASGPASSQNW
jgi:hypothetical protein